MHLNFKSLEPRAFIKLALKNGLVFLFFGFMGCTTPAKIDPQLNLINESDYLNIIDKYTDRTQTYSGLANTVDMRSTLINSRVYFAQLDQMARLYLWEKSKFDEELKKAESNLQKETTVFVSLYTPERKHNDLYKSKSLWKIFLDSGGKRYEGKAVKQKQILSEIQSLYYYHTRFSTAYIVTFPVSMKSIESQSAKLTFTGPVGAATVEFKLQE